MWCKHCGGEIPPSPPPAETAEVTRAKAYRWQAGLVEMSPPAKLETALQRDYRKAEVRHWYKNIVHWAFGIAAAHLGKFEAAHLLLGWAQALVKPCPAKGKKSPTDLLVDDYLLEVAEAMGPTEAAKFVLKWHGNIAGDNKEAVEKRITRLLHR
jgi:hypothetical protein